MSDIFESPEPFHGESILNLLGPQSTLESKLRDDLVDAICLGTNIRMMMGAIFFPRQEYRIRKRLGLWRLEIYEVNNLYYPTRQWETVEWAFTRDGVIPKAVKLSLEGFVVDFGDLDASI